MGVDIHIKVVNGDTLLEDRIFAGYRNYEWFDNLSTRPDKIYENFPAKIGIPKDAPQDIKDDFEHNAFYGFHYLSISDLQNFIKNYKPQMKAGWISKYNAWLYRSKNIIPEELFEDIPADSTPENYEFIEVEDKGELTVLLNKYLIDKNYHPAYIIVYYFDC